MSVILRAALASLVLASSALAWSAKEHIQLTRITAMRLLADARTPEAMKRWLEQAAPGVRSLDEEQRYFLTARVGPTPRGVDGLAFWSVVPDVVAGTDPKEKLIEPFGVHERLLHFVDLELLQADPARRRYAQDLSNKPALADMPRDMKDERWRAAGMLPWRVADCRRRLVQCIRAGRLVDRPGQFPRDEHATRWAGYLAHYIQDSTQPHHATIDYKSLSYLPADAKQTNVHNDMEFRLVDDNLADYPELRKAFWTIFVRKLDEVDDPAANADPWEATMRTLLASYDALPLIGRAAKAAYLDAQGNVRPFHAEAFFSAKGVYRGREMTLMELKAQQLAWAVVRLQALWLSAWNEATATPTSPVEPPAAATTSAPPAESKADPRP